MKSLVVVLIGVLSSFSIPPEQAPVTAHQDRPELVALAKEFRTWRAQGTGAVPNYAERTDLQKKGVADFKRRLEAINTDGWSRHDKADYLVVRSEMDDLDFDLRVIRQVSRNPDFFTTEAARRVMRNIGGRYERAPGVTVPYDAKRAAAILQALNDTSAIVSQAPACLTEAVPEMADMAVQRLTDVRKNYNEFAKVVGQYLPEPYRTQIGPAADAAGAALEKYRGWIEANRAKMKAPYAIGQKAFDWYVQRVLMFPYTSDQLLMQAEMERERNWAFLEFEVQKNRHLPPIGPASNNREFEEWKDATDVMSRVWAQDLDLFTIPPDIGKMRDEDGGIWIEPFGLMAFPKTAMDPDTFMTEFLVPPDHWFSSVYWEKGHRLDPGTNHPHSEFPGHQFEDAVSQRNTCPLRRGHNTRSDSWTNYIEEVQLQLDYPFVRGPHAREWMYGLAIMRAERVYIAVKFAAGSMTPDQVAQYMMKNVPGMEPYVAMQDEVWRKYVDPTQVLTYQVGKFEIYKFMMDEMKRLGDKFSLREFHDTLLNTGQIPVPLARWEITGQDDEVKGLWQPAPLPATDR